MSSVNSPKASPASFAEVHGLEFELGIQGGTGVGPRPTAVCVVTRSRRLHDSGQEPHRDPPQPPKRFMNRVEAHVLDLVAQLFPDPVQRLRDFVVAHQDVVPVALWQLAEELRFYLDYLRMMRSPSAQASASPCRTCTTTPTGPFGSADGLTGSGLGRPIIDGTPGGQRPCHRPQREGGLHHGTQPGWQDHLCADCRAGGHPSRPSRVAGARQFGDASVAGDRRHALPAP